MSARILRKEIHYVLFKKHKLLDVRFILFLLLFYQGSYFPFFPIWLHDINHISKSDTGIIFAAISLFSLLFQPLFGLISDKLGLRKIPAVDYYRHVSDVCAVLYFYLRATVTIQHF